MTAFNPGSQSNGTVCELWCHLEKVDKGTTVDPLADASKQCSKPSREVGKAAKGLGGRTSQAQVASLFSNKRALSYCRIKSLSFFTPYPTHAGHVARDLQPPRANSGDQK